MFMDCRNTDVQSSYTDEGKTQKSSLRRQTQSSYDATPSGPFGETSVGVYRINPRQFTPSTADVIAARCILVALAPCVRGFYGRPRVA